MPPGSDNTVKLSVQLDGAAETDRALENITRRIETMNATAAGGSGGNNTFAQYTAAGTVLAGPPPGLMLPSGPNQGVWLGGSSYYSPSVVMAPGALAPDPLTGTVPILAGMGGANSGGVARAGVSGGGGQNGPQTIMAANVTILGGSVNGGAYGASAPAPPSGQTLTQSLTQTQLLPTQMLPAASQTMNGGMHPLPGWDPFNQRTNVGGSSPGFFHSFYMNAGSGMGGALGQRFMQSPMAGPLANLAQYENFLPAGFAESAGAVLGKIAPILGAAAIGRDLWATGASVASAYQLPGIYQNIRERGVEKSGRLYDPLQLAHDRRIAEIDARDNATEALYNSSFMRTARYIAPWLEYQHDTEYKPKVAGLKNTADERLKYDLSARQFRFSTGATVPKDNPLFAERADYNNSLPSLMAYGQGKNSFYLDYGSYGPDFGAVPSEVAASSGRIGAYMMAPGYERQADAASRGLDVRAFSPQVIASAIARGDYDTLKALAPEFTRMAGGDLQAGLRMQQNAMGRALTLQATRTQSAISGAHLSGGQAQLGLMAANGASGYALAGLTSQLAGNYDSIISGAQANLAAQKATGNPLEIARAQTELMQARAAQAQMRKGAAMQTFQTRETELGALGSFAGAALNRAMFGNSEAAVMQGFDRQDAVLRGRAGNALMMSRSRFLSPEERAGYAAEAANLRNQSEFDLPRQRGDYRLGLASGRLGIVGARASAASEHAGLYGGVEEQLKTALEMASVTRGQLALVKEQSAGEFGPKTQQERLDLQRQQIELQKQLNTSLEQATRSYQSANLSVAQFSQGMASSSANYRQSYFGVGGAAAGVEHGEVVDAARKTLSVAQANFDRVRDLPKDNPFRQQRERELMDAKNGAQGAVQGFAGLSAGVDLERSYAAGQYQMSVMTGTYASWGDIRGTTEGLLKNVGQQGKALWAQRAQGLAAIDSDRTLSDKEKQERKSVLLRDFEMRQYDLGRQSIGYQQQLETGWQGRLISQTVNAPSRAAFVAAQFTQREAARFEQTQSAIFGFSGPGAMEARDNYLHRGVRLATSTIGNVSRPQGFNDTGMAAAMAMGGSGHGVVMPAMAPYFNHADGQVEHAIAQLSQAVQALGQAVRSRSGQGQGGNPIGMGRSSNFLHQLGNTPNVHNSEYARGSSHQ